MRLRALALLLCLGICSSAQATLMVGANSVPLVAGANHVQTVELQSPDNHAVTGGRIVLAIKPIGTTTGSLTFNTTLPGIPNGAVVNAGAKYAITTALPNNPAYTPAPVPPPPAAHTPVSTMADIFWTPTTPGQIPVTANDPIFTVNTIASVDATGTFGLFLVQDPGLLLQQTSHWRGAGTGSVSSLGSPFDMTFDAAGFSTAPLGVIAIPEPGSFALMGLIGLAVGGKGVVGWMRRRRDDEE